MIDPRTLRSLALNAFDPAHAVGDFDRDEPFEIERTVITNDDVADLAGVPFAADSCVFAGCDLSVTDVIGVRNSLFVNCKLRGTRFGRFSPKRGLRWLPASRVLVSDDGPRDGDLRSVPACGERLL